MVDPIKKTIEDVPEKSTNRLSRHVSLRSVLTGLAFVIYFSAGGPGGVGGFHMAPGALVVIFLLVILVNPILHRFGKIPFSKSELMTIWCMLAIALTDSIWIYLPLSIVGPDYFANSENHWKSLVKPYLPDWLFPRNTSTARWFFEGIPAGQNIPWGDWVLTLLPWLLFAVLFYLLLFCLSSILRAQWTENERFSFPIVQIPVEIASGADTQVNPLFKNPMFWMGVSLPLGLHMLNGLATLFPALPSVPLKVDLTPMLQQRPWNEIQPLTIFVVFAVIGFAFLLPLEISFSFGFFFLFYKMECYIGGVYGFDMPAAQGSMARDFCQNQEMGAFLALFAGVIYAARSHLRDVWEKIKHPGGDEEEPMRFRYAFIGILISMTGMILWLWATGVSLFIALIFLLLVILIFVIVSWAVTGGGMFFTQTSFGPMEMMMNGIGSAAVGMHSIGPLRMTQMVYAYDMRSQQMPTMLNGYKAADAGGVNKNSMLKVMALAAVFTVIVGIAQQILYVDHYSAQKLGGWLYTDAPRIPSQQIAGVAQTPVKPSAMRLLWIAGGAIFTIFLLAMRIRYLWFPLHPIGFAFAGSYAMYTVWFSFLIGWFCKVLVNRYGGMKGFLFMRPFFIGLILGDGLSASIWSIVFAFTNVNYPPFSGIS
jgi:hypothetical protein